ncbi:MAG: hypothetical protein E6Q97_23055 [Desulfurellales bacterium]|nr:MAG: hypothetical protein E6Q97_23055 [Desulfurellales bacterium]
MTRLNALCDIGLWWAALAGVAFVFCVFVEMQQPRGEVSTSEAIDRWVISSLALCSCLGVFDLNQWSFLIWGEPLEKTSFAVPFLAAILTPLALVAIYLKLRTGRMWQK